MNRNAHKRGFAAPEYKERKLPGQSYSTKFQRRVQLRAVSVDEVANCVEARQLARALSQKHHTAA